MNKGYLTRDEVAKLLGISTRTVSRKVKQGKILAKGHKGKLRFPIEQFDDIQKEDKSIEKELISTLQKQLLEKDEQIRRLQEDTSIKVIQEQLKEKDKQIENFQSRQYENNVIIERLTQREQLLIETLENNKRKWWQRKK